RSKSLLQLRRRMRGSQLDPVIGDRHGLLRPHAAGGIGDHIHLPGRQLPTSEPSTQSRPIGQVHRPCHRCPTRVIGHRQPHRDLISHRGHPRQRILAVHHQLGDEIRLHSRVMGHHPLTGSNQLHQHRLIGTITQTSLLSLQELRQRRPRRCFGDHRSSLGSHHLRAPPRMAPIHTLSSPHHLGQPHIGPNRQHLKMLLLLPQVQPPTRTSRRNNPPRPRPPPASTPASTPRRPIGRASCRERGR